jgi:hypothetical protein
LWSLSLALLEAEFRPRAALGDGGVDALAVYDGLGFCGDAHFLAGVVPFVGDGGFGAVGVGGGLREGECGRIFAFVEFVSPVGFAVRFVSRGRRKSAR